MTDNATRGGIRGTVLTGLFFIVLGAGFQAACMPTVRVSCPARTSAAPDCDLRWLVAFDRLPVRHTPLPALQPPVEIARTAAARRGGTDTIYLNTANGPVRAIMWGDHMTLQRDLREPLRAYFADPHAPAIDLTMIPARWTDPGGDAPNRLVRQAHPGRLAANVFVALGLLCWVWLPVQILTSLGRRPYEESAAEEGSRRD